MAPHASGSSLRTALGAAWLLVLLCLPAFSEALEGDLLLPESVGILREKGTGKELARHEGWVPDEILPVRGGLGSHWLVLWRSHPMRRYTRPELWRQLGDSLRRVWPREGQELSWYLSELSLRAFKGRDQLLVQRALVDENFDAPFLQVHETFGFRAGSFRSLGISYEPPKTPAQSLNLLVVRLREGDRKAAEALVQAIPAESREERRRATLLLGVPESASRRDQARRDLLEIANGRGADALEAADLLLEMKTKEARSGQ